MLTKNAACFFIVIWQPSIDFIPYNFYRLDSFQLVVYVKFLVSIGTVNFRILLNFPGCATRKRLGSAVMDSHAIHLRLEGHITISPPQEPANRWSKPEVRIRWKIYSVSQVNAIFPTQNSTPKKFIKSGPECRSYLRSIMKLNCASTTIRIFRRFSGWIPRGRKSLKLFSVHLTFRSWLLDITYLSRTADFLKFCILFMFSLQLMTADQRLQITVA